MGNRQSGWVVRPYRILPILIIAVALLVGPSGAVVGTRVANHPPATASSAGPANPVQTPIATPIPTWALLRPNATIGSLLHSENDPKDGYVFSGGGGGGYYGGVDFGAGYYNGTKWTPLATTNTPAGIVDYSYDYADHYVLGVTYNGGTYAYSGGQWRAIQTYSSPGANTANITYDGSDGYVIEYVKVTFPTPECAGTWAYVHGAWANRCTAHYPSPRSGGLIAFDYNSSDHYVVLFGGYGCTTNNCTNMGNLNDTWIYHSGDWSPVSTGNTHPPAIGTRGFNPSKLLYDPSTGMDVAFQNGSSSLWGFNHGSWHQIPVSKWPDSAPGQPVPTFGPALGGKAVMEAGQWCVLPNGYSSYGDPSRCPMISIFSNGTWINESPPAPHFPAQITDMAYDWADHELVAIGHFSLAGLYDPLETLALSAGSWKVVATSPPGFVRDLVYDPSAGYLLGIVNNYNTNYTLVTTTWSFHNNQWTQLYPNQAPPPSWHPYSQGASDYDAAYDQQDHSVVLYNGGPLMWFFANGQWTNKSLVCYSCTFPGGFGTRLVNDTAHGYLLGVVANQTWKFSNGTWTQLHPHHHAWWGDAALTFDSTRNYVLLDGATAGGVWRWSHGDWTSIKPKGSSGPWGGGYYPVLAYDATSRLDYLPLFDYNANSMPYISTFGVQKTYLLTVQETGLPTGTKWSFSADLSILGLGASATQNLSSATISLPVENGTWSVNFSTIGRYLPSVHVVSVSIAGAGATVLVHFSKLFSVTFTQSGLARGKLWSVDFEGSIQMTNTSTIVFNATNGTAYYHVGKVPGHPATPSSGSTRVAGRAVHIVVTFT